MIFCQIFLFLNLGTPELILIGFVALLLFGGKKLPELARGLGKGLRDFKEASEGLKTEINSQINTIEEVKTEAIAKIEEIAKEATSEVSDKNAEPQSQQYDEHAYGETGYNEEPVYNEGPQYNESGYNEEPQYHETTLMPENPTPGIQSSEPVTAKSKAPKKKLKTEKS